MSFAAKTTSLQAYHLHLFRKAIHPELFPIEGRKDVIHGEYAFEAWIFRGGHVLLFSHGGICLSEVVTDSSDNLSDRALVTALPCAGEKDHEETFSDRIEYLASIQTETLSDHLYLATYNEMVEHGRDSNCITATWSDEFGNNLSLIDTQRYHDEIHIQGYHLRSDCSLVLRTQTMFKTTEPKPESESEESEEEAVSTESEK